MYFRQLETPQTLFSDLTKKKTSYPPPSMSGHVHLLAFELSSNDCCAGDGEREAGAASSGHGGEVQRGVELLAGEEQPPRVLPVPGGAEELLLLQGDPQGRVHRGQPLHARQVLGQRLPGGSTGGGYAYDGHLLQHIKRSLALCCAYEAQPPSAYQAVTGSVLLTSQHDC